MLQFVLNTSAIYPSRLHTKYHVINARLSCLGAQFENVARLVLSRRGAR